MPIDGRVNNLNHDVASTLQRLQRVNPGSITEAGVKELKASILKDKVIDASEQDLIYELTQDTARNVSVYTAGGQAPVAVTYPAKGPAKQALTDILNQNERVEENWSAGAEGFKKLTAIYSRSPEDAQRIVNFAADKLSEAWGNSSMGNGYKPLRDLIGSVYGFATAPGANVDAGRNILHSAMKQVDQKANDKIPDFFYNWVRPGGYI